MPFIPCCLHVLIFYDSILRHLLIPFKAQYLCVQGRRVRQAAADAASREREGEWVGPAHSR